MSILTAVNGETIPDHSITFGLELSNQLDDELVVLYVMPQEQFDERWEERPDYYIDSAKADAEDTARSVVVETVGETDGISIRGRVGEPAEEILDEAKRVHARYIVVAGHKRSPVGKAIFGSTTQSVLLHSETPVFTVPTAGITRAADETNPIVAAVDRSDRSERVVSEAQSLANELDRPVHIVHVITREKFFELERVRREDLDRPVDTEEMRSMAKAVASTAAESTEGAFTSVGLVGDPSEELLQYAGESDASFIVTSGRKRSPIGKVLFGSVVQSILLNADRPVLTLLSET